MAFENMALYLFAARISHFFHSPISNASLQGLLIIPLMATLDTLIKNTHRLIGTPNLHLHKIRLAKTTRGAYRHGPIDIFPCRCSSEDVIDFFTIGGNRFLDLGEDDFLGVGTGGAGEDIGGRFRRCGVGGGGGDDLEEGAVEGAEPHGYVFVVLIAGSSRWV